MRRQDAVCSISVIFGGLCGGLSNIAFFQIGYDF